MDLFYEISMGFFYMRESLLLCQFAMTLSKYCGDNPPPNYLGMIFPIPPKFPPMQIGQREQGSVKQMFV